MQPLRHVITFYKGRGYHSDNCKQIDTPRDRGVGGGRGSTYPPPKYF